MCKIEQALSKPLSFRAFCTPPAEEQPVGGTQELNRFSIHSLADALVSGGPGCDPDALSHSETRREVRTLGNHERKHVVALLRQRAPAGTSGKAEARTSPAMTKCLTSATKLGVVTCVQGCSPER